MISNQHQQKSQSHQLLAGCVIQHHKIPLLVVYIHANTAQVRSMLHAATFHFLTNRLPHVGIYTQLYQHTNKYLKKKYINVHYLTLKYFAHSTTGMQEAKFRTIASSMHSHKSRKYAEFVIMERNRIMLLFQSA